MLQPPQFLASPSVATSQPLTVLLSQLANPGRQESKVQTLLMHALLALGMLHCGQVQPPLAHTRFTGQTMPQPPQFLALAPVGVSQPFTLLPSQLANPGRQVSMTHCLATQMALALGKLHTGQSHWPLAQI